MKQSTTLRADVLRVTRYRSFNVLTSALTKLVGEHGKVRVLKELVALTNAAPSDREILFRHYRLMVSSKADLGVLRVAALYAGHGLFAASRRRGSPLWEWVEFCWHYDRLRGKPTALQAVLYSGVEKCKATLYGGRVDRAPAAREPARRLAA